MNLPKPIRNFLIGFGSLLAGVVLFWVLLSNWRKHIEEANKRVKERPMPTYNPYEYEAEVKKELEKIQAATAEEITARFNKRFGG
jgi:type II secretory pathway component PulM